MQELDYKKLGLIAGIECHQQLAGKKLFCSCDANLLQKEPNYIVKRRLRPVASETGEFDKAAMQEFLKGREYIYYGYNENCLVELDEEPPHKMNQNALETALEIAKKTDSKVFDEVTVMRKMVIDGSNTSGFQRTSLIAIDGEIELDSGKKVGVASICLEEDSAQNVESSDDKIIYSLDRLGIPLIEFTTKPDLRTPTEVKECAAKIGEYLRITGYAKRGLGSIRQDVNISIKGGTRIEIKGVQYLDLIEKYVENEVLRQMNLLKVRDEITKRVPKEKQVLDIVDITKIIEKIDNEKVALNIKNGYRALAIRLLGFRGLLGFEVQPNRRVGTELSNYAKVINKVKGLFHTDELPKYGINKDMILGIEKELGCKDNDAFVIIIEKEDIAIPALKTVFNRAMQIYEGIPKETRNPLEDGTSEYARPLPGAARMYPETDVRPIAISKEIINKIKVPKSYSERIKEYKKIGLNEQYATQVAESNYAKEFEELVKLYSPLTAAEFVLAITDDKIDISKIKSLLDMEKEGKIDKKEFRKIYPLTKTKSIKEIVKEFEKSNLDLESKKIIETIISERTEFINQRKESALNPIMGEALKQIKAKTGLSPDMRVLSKYIEGEIKKRL